MKKSPKSRTKTMAFVDIEGIEGISKTGGIRSLMLLNHS